MNKGRFVIFLAVIAIMDFAGFLISTDYIYSSQLKWDIALYAQTGEVSNDENLKTAIIAKKTADKEVSLSELYKTIDVKRYGINSTKVTTVLQMIPILEQKDYQKIQPPMTYWDSIRILLMASVGLFIILTICGIMMDKMDLDIRYRHI